MSDGLTNADLLSLFGHFLMLSLLAIGGAISTAPDVHRYVVTERGWLTDAEFTTSIALAQAAPGPNLLFVAVVGWNVAGPMGAAVTMFGIMLPSTTLALWATRWRNQRREARGVRAFSAGMAPITVGLVLATAWLLAEPTREQPVGWALMLLTVVVMLKTRLSPIWMIAVGAVVGAMGWI
ncbi:chromate transporter [Caldimonas brevitalea]|uniref:Chromate transporter n=1 Tax=Caldimonas brevitalea TaxID=413882 RepID=A0A0G3BSR2_9BURK|nr:chromate transporter [Caldimonas brevitalea]AKJ29585.1 chromate transporter [Caldimonas brevitalea]